MEVTRTLTVHLLLAILNFICIHHHCNDANDDNDSNGSNDHGYLALDDHPHILHLQA